MVITTDEILEILKHVKDPEIPVLSVVDMRIISAIQIENNSVQISMTPTFVGCPAIDMIKNNIHKALTDASIENVSVLVDLETPWNSDKMTAEAKEKLEKFGIAPPTTAKGELTLEMLDRVRCPHCHSTDTTLNSPFGSTLCRAIRFCFSCKQGFEQFKPVV
jgi:ring-1,2-phenylacetyl-CoA epoxidase subunit PaaD